MLMKNIFIVGISFLVSILNVSISNAQLNTDSLKNLIDHSDNETILMQALNHYAYQLYRSQADTAILYANKALKLAEKSKNNKEIFSALNLLGLAYQTKGSYHISLDYFKRELEYLPENDLNRAKTYHNMALTYRLLENNNDALKNELLAIKIFEINQDSVLIGAVYQTMCNIYRDLGDFNKAEEYILKSIKIFESIKNTGIDNRLSMLANSYTNYGNLLQKEGRLNEAVEKHNMGVQLHKKSGDLFNLAFAHENLGDDYVKLKKYNEALLNYNIAKEIMHQLNSETDVGYELMNISNVYQMTGNYSSALLNLDSAMNIFTRNNADAYLLEVYFSKYSIYDLLKDPVNALENYKKYNKLKDSLNTEDKKSELLRLKEEFETAQKEQQITLLQTENALKDKEKQVQIVFRNIAILIIIVVIFFGILMWNRFRIKQQIKQLEIRNSIASDLHDDIGSTLSSISLYSEMVNDQIKDINPKSVPLLNQISNNSKEMIENMSDIVWAIKPSNDVFKYIESRMFNFATEICNVKNIHLIFNRNELLEHFNLPMQQRRDLYLIFKEAINNAVKYSGCTEIEIRFQKTQSTFIMEITDNGVGFAKELLNGSKQKIFTHGGNGLTNMQMRAAEHKGKCEVATSPGNGTKITLALPIP